MRTAISLAILASLTACVALAQSVEPPRPRPAHPSEQVVEEPEEPTAGDDEETAQPQEPEPKPEDLTPPRETETELAVCEAALAERGVEFERREAISGEGACGVWNPYVVKRIAPDITVEPDTELTCKTVLALARWVQDMVMPAARALGDNVRLAGITHGSTYVCRRRNNQQNARISQHALGRAIDVVTFRFQGRDPIGVRPRTGDGKIEEAFQRAARASACLYFTTVLGPGSDAFHDDNLHLDVVSRTRGFRLCQ